MASELMRVFDSPWTFSRRPSPLPADLRPAWRITVIVLALRRCCLGGKSSLARLHVLNWGVRTQLGRRNLLRAVENDIAPEALILRFEPSLNRALDLAQGLRLIAAPSGDRVHLTPVGRELVAAVESINHCLATEKTFFAELGFRLTEAQVKQLTVSIGDRL